jgi:polar amino acid transport system substrate-binding protein
MTMFSKMRLMVAALIVLCLTAGAALAQSTEATIKAIKDAGVLRAAVAESLPMQFKDPKTGQWEGYNVDMAKDLAEVLGVKLELVDATWQTLIPGLMAKQYDIVMVDMWATPERAQTVVFTNPYNLYGWAVMIRSDLAATKWEDLNTSGTTISVLSGTADEQTAKRFFPKANVHGLVSENVNAPRMEVANGRTDAHVTDLLNIKIFMSQNPNAKVKLLQPERIMNPTGLAYAIRPGDYHFLNFLNTWIASRRDGGKADELKKKWITEYDWSKKQ